MIERQRETNTNGRVEAASHSGGFLKGLVAGALVGTAAGVLMAPQIYGALRNVRRELSDAAADASHVATEKYQEATARVGDAVEDLQQKGRAVYTKALNVVVRGAEDVKARATETQTELDQRTADAVHRSR